VTLLLALGVSWLTLSSLGVVLGVGICRAGHAEDVARGYVDP
jgi:hypothetical protein